MIRPSSRVLLSTQSDSIFGARIRAERSRRLWHDGLAADKPAATSLPRSLSADISVRQRSAVLWRGTDLRVQFLVGTVVDETV